MLSTHMANQEDKLLVEHKVSSVAGHPNDKGTPREVFVHKFLAGHLSANVAIGRQRRRRPSRAQKGLSCPGSQ